MSTAIYIVASYAFLAWVFRLVFREEGPFRPVGGVMWCVRHSGIADECSSDPDHCDMADLWDEHPCDLRDLYIRKTSILREWINKRKRARP